MATARMASAPSTGHAAGIFSFAAAGARLPLATASCICAVGGPRLPRTLRAIPGNSLDAHAVELKDAEGCSVVTGPALRALYFPYARSLDLTFLKQSILLFDQVLFVDPLERVVRENIGYSVAERDWVQADKWRAVNEDYLALLDSGDVATVDSLSLVRQYDGLLAQAMLADRDDAEFIRSAAELASRDYWGIYSDKIPSDSLLAEAATFTGTRFWCHPTQITSPAEAWEQDKSTSERYRRMLHIPSSPFIMSVAHDYIPMACGYSVNINIALLLAELHGFVPVTDDPTALRLLGLKHKRAANGIAAHEMPRSVQGFRRSPEYLQRYNAFGRTIAEALLPAGQLRERSVADIVRLKRNEQDAYERFRLLLLDFVSQTTSEPWSGAFEAEMVRLIDTKLLPESRRVKDHLSTAYDKMFGSIVQKTAAAASPTVAVSVLSHLSAGQILAMSAAAVTGGASIAIPELVQLWRERREGRRNGLAFLLRL